MGPLTAKIMKEALTKLDKLLVLDSRDPVTLVIGGGGAMVLAHHFPLGTADIDAIAKGIEIGPLDEYVKQIAQELNLPKDWLNPYFSSFSYTLPADYAKRLVPVFQGKKIKALALGKEDMLIMKSFAHRQKDVGHAKSLIKQGVDLKIVEAQLDALHAKRIRGAAEAIDFLNDVLEQLE